MKTFLAIAATTLIAAISSEISADAISSAKNGVAMIINGDSTSSAVAIGIKGEPVNYFLTNFHCVANEDWTLSKEQIQIAVGNMESPYDRTNAAVVYFSKDYDFALLKSETPIQNIIPQPICTEEIELGDKVFALGFSSESRIGETVYATPDSLVYADGEITNLSFDVLYNENFEYPHIVKEQYMTTMRLTSGYSGGPLLNKDGAVIGLNSGTHYKLKSDGTYEYLNSYAVKTGVIADILNQYGIEYQTYSSLNKNNITTLSENANSEQKYNQLLIIAIVLAIALVAVALAVIYITSGKKNENHKEFTENTFHTQPDFEENGGINITQVIKADSANTLTKKFAHYRLIIDNSDQVSIFEHDIINGITYDIKIGDHPVARICANNNTATVSALSDVYPLYLAIPKNAEVHEIYKNSDNNNVIIPILIKEQNQEKQLYLGDINRHLIFTQK